MGGVSITLEQLLEFHELQRMVYGSNRVVVLGAGLVGGAYTRELISLSTINNILKYCAGGEDLTQEQWRRLMGQIQYPVGWSGKGPLDEIIFTTRTYPELAFQHDLIKAFLRTALPERLIKQNMEGITIECIDTPPYNVGPYQIRPITTHLDVNMECGLSIFGTALDVIPNKGERIEDTELYEFLRMVYYGLHRNPLEDIHAQLSNIEFLNSIPPDQIGLGAVAVAFPLASMAAYIKDETSKVTGLNLVSDIMNIIYSFGRRYKVPLLLYFGTMGSGGLGTLMHFTHQEQTDKPVGLPGKYSAAGATVNTGGVQARNNGYPEIKIFQPASALGVDYIIWGEPSFLRVPNAPETVQFEIRNNGLRVPLYSALKIPLDQSLSHQTINWKAMRLENQWLTGVVVRTGENGAFSPLQFMLLTRPDQMGLTSGQFVGAVGAAETVGTSTGYNILTGGQPIPPISAGQTLRQEVLRTIETIQFHNSLGADVFPALGSDYIKKELAMAGILYRFLLENNESGEPSIQDLARYKPQELAEKLKAFMINNPHLINRLTSIGLSVFFEDAIYVGPFNSYAASGGLSIETPFDLQDILSSPYETDRLAIMNGIDLGPAWRAYNDETGEIYHSRKEIMPGDHLFESGVKTYIERAKVILDILMSGSKRDREEGRLSSSDTDFWLNQTYNGVTLFDPVQFVAQFLGRGRPYVD